MQSLTRHYVMEGESYEGPCETPLNGALIQTVDHQLFFPGRAALLRVLPHHHSEASAESCERVRMDE